MSDVGNSVRFSRVDEKTEEWRIGCRYEDISRVSLW